MNARELVALGLPQECVAVAFDALKTSRLISQPADAAHRIGEILAKPENFAVDAHFSALAESVVAVRTQLEQAKASWGRNPHGTPASFAQWGERDDQGSIDQMNAACELPVAVQGARRFCRSAERKAAARARPEVRGLSIQACVTCVSPWFAAAK